MRSKLPDVGTTIFTEMSQLALTHQAINLGQGFPDYNPDRQLIQCVNEAMAAGHNQYAPMQGIAALRHQVAQKIARLHGHEYDSEAEITITSGATEALAAAITALVHPGDEVILIDPAYDLYAPVVRLAGGVIRRVAMTPPNQGTPHYSMDWEKLSAVINKNTRVILLNFPNNPTGTILKANDLKCLEEIVSRYDIVLISDEAYEHIVFDGQHHLSLSGRAALVDRSIIISSFGKTFHATGWKIGYLCAPLHLTAEIRKVHQYMVFSVPTPMQYGLADYLEKYARLDQLSAFYQQKRDRLVKGLANSAFRPLTSQGTFFLLVDTSRVGNMNEKEMARQLTIDHHIATIPVSAFYENPDAPEANHGLLRLCFAKREITLDQALKALQDVRKLG